MFIKKLGIHSFRGIENVNIEFSRPRSKYFNNLNLSVLVGENGTGKSTTLQLLTYIFSPSSRQKVLFEPPEFSIAYELDGESLNHDNSQEYPHKVPTKIIVSSFSVFDPYQPRFVHPRIRRRHFEGEEVVETKYVYCGPSEGGYSSLDSVIQSIMQALFIPREDQIKQHCYYELLRKIGCRTAIGLVIDYRQLQQLALKEAETEKERKIILEYYNRLKDLRRYNNVLFPRKRPTHFCIPIDNFGLELLDLYNWLVELDINPCVKDFIFENENNQMVLLSEMSSGEITILFRFLPLVIEMEENVLVVIDEPETHLHPRWAREFIWFLTDLFKDYKAHIILATHSPTIVSDVPMECIIGLRKKEGLIHQYRPKDRTLGGHPTELLRDVFDTYELAGHYAMMNINRVIELLGQENLSPEQLLEARNIYQDLSTTIDKYKLYQKYKRYLED